MGKETEICLSNIPQNELALPPTQLQFLRRGQSTAVAHNALLPEKLEVKCLRSTARKRGALEVKGVKVNIRWDARKYIQAKLLFINSYGYPVIGSCMHSLISLIKQRVNRDSEGSVRVQPWT